MTAGPAPLLGAQEGHRRSGERSLSGAGGGFVAPVQGACAARAGTKDPRERGGQPPVPASHEGDEGGDEQGADDDGVEEYPGGEGGGDDPDELVGRAAQGQERHGDDHGGAGDEPPGPRQSGDDRLVGGTRAVVLLADAGKHEDLVVHGQPEQAGEHDDGNPVAGRRGRGRAVKEIGAVSLLPEQDHEAERRAEGDQVERDRLDREHDRPEGPDEDDQAQQRDHCEDEGEVAVDGAGESQVGGGGAAYLRAAGDGAEPRAQRGDDRLAGGGAALGRRDDGQYAVRAAAEGRGGGGQDGPDARGVEGDRGGLVDGGRSAVGEDHDGEVSGAWHAGRPQLTEGLRGGAALRQ